MTPPFEAALKRLSPTQLKAVEWNQGAALVLAGPGVGKTTVLTARIARILNDSQKRNFRVLALTFTTKAGDEMRERVESLVPGLSGRTVVGTFHSFCARQLRLHGSHLNFSPDFGIYDQDEDREELLRDALKIAAANGEPFTADDVRWLRAIDRLRSNLITPERAANCFRDSRSGARAARVYEIYEDALREHSVMDFNGLILNMCRLAHDVPAVAARIRQSYPYWLIDEFQDTTPAQYRLIRSLADTDFKNVFAVADDDQIIYQWAGASYRQVRSFQEHFSPALMQLSENRRCPPEIVTAANNLIAHNVDRTTEKERLVSTLPNTGAAIRIREYSTDAEEANAISLEVAALEPSTLRKAAVLGRTRALLEPVVASLKDAGVAASIATRRRSFVSPQFVWLYSTLNLSIRPTDKRTFARMVGAANRIASVELDAALLAAEAASLDINYLESWALTAQDTPCGTLKRLSEYASRLVLSRRHWRRVLAEALDWLPTTAAADKGLFSDAEEDKAAWEEATRAIRDERGGLPELDELLQGIALRPKEPPPVANAIRLFTIHAAKGLEFDDVWLLGAAESILPSWQSLKPNASPAELEEERRAFFVAITRTRRRLLVSHANRYRGWVRKPSRFIAEMNLRDWNSFG